MYSATNDPPKSYGVRLARPARMRRAELPGAPSSSSAIPKAGSVILAVSLASLLAACDGKAFAPKVDGTTTAPAAESAAPAPETPSADAAAAAQGIASALPGRSITVSATGSIKAVPDKASITISVETQKASSSEAETEQARVVAGLLATLLEKGVDEADVQTAYTSLSPVYADNGDVVVVTDSGSSAAQDRPEAADTIMGYEMVTALTVSELDIDRVGEVVEACLKAGATGVSGPNYYVSSYDEAYARALTAAVRAAHEKAKVLAEAAGAKLGSVTSMEEGYQNGTYRTKDEALSLSAFGAEAGAPSYEVVPGEVSIDATVTVSYEMGA